jgi:hypothetical protein
MIAAAPGRRLSIVKAWGSPIRVQMRTQTQSFAQTQCGAQSDFYSCAAV